MYICLEFLFWSPQTLNGTICLFSLGISSYQQAKNIWGQKGTEGSVQHLLCRYKYTNLTRQLLRVKKEKSQFKHAMVYFKCEQCGKEAAMKWRQSKNERWVGCRGGKGTATFNPLKHSTFISLDYQPSNAAINTDLK